MVERVMKQVFETSKSGPKKTLEFAGGMDHCSFASERGVKHGDTDTFSCHYWV